MPSEEIPQKHHDSDSDSDSEEEIEKFPSVYVDVTKLTPLSPEVISKQVRVPLGAIFMFEKKRENIDI